MTEKRFKETISTGIVTDTITGKQYKCEMRIDDELLELLNQLSDENEQLKSENQSLLKTAYHVDTIAHEDRDYAERMHKENKQLKKELEKFKEWEKHIRDVRRDDLDRVFKMSIYEIAEAFEYYKERISILSQLLDFADAIIDLSDDEKAKEGWENMNTKLNQKWEKISDKLGD